jgi:hypothetical protein
MWSFEDQPAQLQCAGLTEICLNCSHMFCPLCMESVAYEGDVEIYYMCHECGEWGGTWGGTRRGPANLDKYVFDYRPKIPQSNRLRMGNGKENTSLTVLPSVIIENSYLAASLLGNELPGFAHAKSHQSAATDVASLRAAEASVEKGSEGIFQCQNEGSLTPNTDEQLEVGAQAFKPSISQVPGPEIDTRSAYNGEDYDIGDTPESSNLSRGSSRNARFNSTPPTTDDDMSDDGMEDPNRRSIHHQVTQDFLQSQEFLVLFKAFLVTVICYGNDNSGSPSHTNPSTTRTFSNSNGDQSATGRGTKRKAPDKPYPPPGGGDDSDEDDEDDPKRRKPDPGHHKSRPLICPYYACFRDRFQDCEACTTAKDGLAYLK